MKPFEMVKTFHDRYPLVGPIMWMLSVQYFLAQFFVASAWSSAYSLANNTISDLGNTACGIYGQRFVCSPLHSLMNASFITLGIFMAVGSLLIYQEFKKTKVSLIGFSLMAIAGVGTILVGLFPENTIDSLHVIGALLPFLLGNIGIVVLGVSLTVPKSLRIYSVLTGAIALAALIFYVSDKYLGLGQGGMERIVAYPQTIWLIVFGIYISKNHTIRILRKHSNTKN